MKLTNHYYKMRRQQAGAATMVVVMVLFFIMAMMAAFANRNLMFEQRIASNYYRSGVALEAADAGVEWALTMLNSGNINDSCRATGNPTVSFRDRYLTLNRDTRVIQAKYFDPSNVSSCVHNASGTTGWVCQCPDGAWVEADNSAANQNRLQPSFVVSFKDAIVRPLDPISPGVIKIISAGCSSSLTVSCSNVNTGMDSSLGSASVTITAALVSALKMPPATPLTVKGTVTMDSTGMGLHNADPRSNGLLMLAGGAASGWVDGRLDSLPGTPSREALIASDPGLAGKTADQMFAMFFGVSPARYKNQPAVRRITCATDCAATLVTAYGQGVRLAWVDGDMSLSSNVNLGTATAPMLVIATGNVAISGAMQLTGLIYARGNIQWTNTSGSMSRLTGALIGERNFVSVGAADIWYQSAIVDELRNRAGSFVRVPGSWWDQP